MAKAPQACSVCHLAAHLWFTQYGCQKNMRARERREWVYSLAVARHSLSRCWERVQDDA